MNQSNHSIKKTIAAIMCIALCTQGTMVLSLVLPGAAAQFPSASEVSIQLLYSLTSGAGILGSLLAGWLAGKTTKKNIMIGIFTIVPLAGLLGAFCYNSLPVLYVVSFLVGMCLFANSITMNSLIGEHLQGELRARITGLSSLAVNGGGIVLTLTAGRLGAGKWQNTYLTYLVFVLVLFAVVALLPKGIVEKPEEGQTEKKRVGAAYGKMVLQVILFGIAFAAYTTNVSMLILQSGFGDTTQASYANTCFMAGAVLAGIALPYLLRIFSSKTLPVGMLFLVGGFVTLYFAQSIWLVYVGALLIGMGFGTFLPASFSIIPNLVPLSSLSMAMAVFSVGSSSAQMISPTIVTTLAGLLGEGMKNRFLIAIVFLILGIIIGCLPQGKKTEN